MAYKHFCLGHVNWGVPNMSVLLLISLLLNVTFSLQKVSKSGVRENISTPAMLCDVMSLTVTMHYISGEAVTHCIAFESLKAMLSYDWLCTICKRRAFMTQEICNISCYMLYIMQKPS